MSEPPIWCVNVTEPIVSLSIWDVPEGERWRRLWWSYVVLPRRPRPPWSQLP
jgi:hypothetical protein